MSIEDRDYYRDEVAKKTGGKRPAQSQGSDVLNSVISETAKRPKKPRTATLFRKPLLLEKRYEPTAKKQGFSKLLMILIWLCVFAVVWFAYSSTRH